MIDDKGNEIISKEENKWREYKKQFEKTIENYKTQIELDEVLIAYINKKIKKCSN